MTHKPIYLHNLSFVLPHKTCFDDVNLRIGYGQRIGIIGNNGSGKSTLLKMITTALPPDIRVGFVPQMSTEDGRSGAELFHRQLSTALASVPDLLMLDEPTNHLDGDNRRALRRMLVSFAHTIIIATHDVELLHHHCDHFIHLHDGRVTMFSGSYRDFEQQRERDKKAIDDELALLEKSRQRNHESLMQEQARAKTSRSKGEKSIKQKKWPTIIATAKARRAEHTAGKKKAALNDERQELIARRALLTRAEIVTPKFHFASREKTGAVISLQDASYGYHDEPQLVKNINTTIYAGERIALVGKNASGKTSFFRALLNDHRISKTGLWQTPSLSDIGYLDQHYRNLDDALAPFSSVSKAQPSWSVTEIRHHLNSFLFRKNEEVLTPIATLSGGEKARLSLCLIAAKTPQVLLLDEITNNIDHTTREHLLTTLNAFTGTLMIISHDEDFLTRLGTTVFHQLDP